MEVPCLGEPHPTPLKNPPHLSKRVGDLPGVYKSQRHTIWVKAALSFPIHDYCQWCVQRQLEDITGNCAISIAGILSDGRNPPYVLLRAVYVQKQRSADSPPVRASTSDARAPYEPCGRSTCEYGLLTDELHRLWRDHVGIRPRYAGRGAPASRSLTFDINNTATLRVSINNNKCSSGEL
ncbi:hypothetical protein Bbelb_143620 [Branchiostoma belcheri]|nr:hypothetical protein Bbelb_143620 [Branchiostoma belcheri]